MDTVVFDCFGVLFTEGWYIERVLARRLAGIITLEDLRARYRLLATGRMDRPTFWAGLVEDYPAFERSFMGELAVDAQADAVLRQLAGRYHLALCSEGVGAWYELLWAAHGLRDRFSVAALSCDLGVTKPSLKFFEATERLLPPGRRAFIDDKLENHRVAATLGWHTIWLNRVGPDTDFSPDVTITELAEVPDILPW
jgi:FMN phosphatase YigB (HAD superfamily)